METPDLEMTSPATITRCNLVYVCEHNLKKSELIQKQLPLLTLREITGKIIQILTPLPQSAILKIVKMTRLIFYRPLGNS